MENVGIYTPPQKASVVSGGSSSANFQPSLTVSDLEVTQPAQDKLFEIISQTDEEVNAIRIYISGGGCGGLSYGMTFTDEKSDFDTTLQFDGFKILVDVVALNYLKGAQIDYIQEVGRERFVFNNVFAETGGSGVCGGCGAAGAVAVAVAAAANRPLINTPHQYQAGPGSKPGLVLLVAPSGSYRIAAYTRAAHTLGMPILVVSNSAHSLVSEVASGITVDFSQPELAYSDIVTAIDGKNIACVLATDDSCVALCSRVAQYLNLPQNSPRAALLTQRKDLARAALADAGCNTPSFQLIEIACASAASLAIEYPVVIKPLALSASRGVIRADNDAEYEAALQRIDAILASSGQQGETRDHLLVESYIDGAEYAVEGFVVAGQFRLLTIFDKPEPLTGPYFEETYYLTPSQLDENRKAELIGEVERCCSAYGLEHGPVHAEARLTDSGPVLLELAARTIGGQCGQLIEFSMRQKLEELVIQGMCGITIAADTKAESAGVLMIPITDTGILKRVEGLTEALQTEYVRDIEIHINPGYELIPLPEGASYLGFIFAQAPEFAQTLAALKNAYSKLRFVTQPRWDLMAG